MVIDQIRKVITHFAPDCGINAHIFLDYRNGINVKSNTHEKVL